jgi:hypothetical protein
MVGHTVTLGHGQPECIPDNRPAVGSSVNRPFLVLGDPSRNVEVWATDEHRFGLKPILRRVWAPKGQWPIALGHHRYKWLYVTAFVQPISGETFWYDRGVEAVFRRAAGAVCA